jgi:hypothetical protein
MTAVVRRSLLVATPLVLAVVLLLHPQGGERVYEGVRHDLTAWLGVHIALAVLAGLMALAAYRLLDGLDSRAATISRRALGPFVVFFIAWEATLGIGTGILVGHANGLPAGERAEVAAAIQEFFNNPLTGSFSVFGTIGNTAWIVAMIAAALAFRGAGASRALTLLVGCSSVFVLHDAGPIGAFGLVSFAAAAVLVERAGPSAYPARRTGTAPAGPSSASGMGIGPLPLASWSRMRSRRPTSISAGGASKRSR